MGWGAEGEGGDTSKVFRSTVPAFVLGPTVKVLFFNPQPSGINPGVSKLLPNKFSIVPFLGIQKTWT